MACDRQTQRVALVQRSSAALARGPCVGGFGESMPGSPAPLQSPVDGAGDRATQQQQAKTFSVRSTQYAVPCSLCD